MKQCPLIEAMSGIKARVSTGANLQLRARPTDDTSFCSRIGCKQLWQSPQRAAVS
jgi:hypothetical protein